jgi:regulator of nucleoside diphosphate kinase
MTERNIFITGSDKERLEGLIAAAEEAGSHSGQDLASLAEELSRATVVDSREVAADVVTMNSKVRIRDMDTSEEKTLVLVFPGVADIARGAVSVLAPIGTALLGYAKGDVVEWSVPSGIRRFRIEDILYQPEASGDFHL